MGELIIITNPHARQNSKDPERFERFQRMVGDQGTVYQTQQLDQLEQTCRQLLTKEIDLIAICGGDGTNHLVTTALIRTFQEAARPLPPLTYLKGGSMNTIAWGLNIRCPAEKVLTHLLQVRQAGRPLATQRQGTLHINDAYGYFFGNGYAVNFLEEYYNANSTSGPRRAAEITYKAIGAVLSRNEMHQRLARKFEAEILADGKPLGFPAYGMIMAGFIEYIGIGFKPLYRAHEREGHFHLVATGFNPGRILAQIHRFYTGKPLIGPHHFDDLVQDLQIRGAAPIGYTIDGELYRNETTIHLRPGPTLDVVVDSPQ
ncbi:MAG: hypothetical protein GX444_13100 [Myxococcales bacterium]|nr:hypothetical protein [Myxococcales bacterium]